MTPLELEDARRTAPTPERCGSLFFQHTEADRTLLRKHDHFLWRLRVLLGEGPLSVTDLAEKYGIKVTTLRKKLRIAKAFGYVTVENSQVTYREVRK